MNTSGDFASCANCGMQFKMERIQQMLVELSGPVSVEGVANIENLIARADEFRLNQEYDKAIDYYERALDLDPSCLQAKVGQALSNRIGNIIEHKLDCEVMKLERDVRYLPEWSTAKSRLIELDPASPKVLWMDDIEGKMLNNLEDAAEPHAGQPNQIEVREGFTIYSFHGLNRLLHDDSSQSNYSEKHFEVFTIGDKKGIVIIKEGIDCLAENYASLLENGTFYTGPYGAHNGAHEYILICSAKSEKSLLPLAKALHKIAINRKDKYERSRYLSHLAGTKFVIWHKDPNDLNSLALNCSATIYESAKELGGPSGLYHPPAIGSLGNIREVILSNKLLIFKLKDPQIEDTEYAFHLDWHDLAEPNFINCWSTKHTNNHCLVSELSGKSFHKVPKHFQNNTLLTLTNNREEADAIVQKLTGVVIESGWKVRIEAKTRSRSNRYTNGSYEPQYERNETFRL